MLSPRRQVMHVEQEDALHRRVLDRRASEHAGRYDHGDVRQQPGEGPTDDLIASAMAAARMAEPYPELLAASSHLLAVGRASAGTSA